MGIQLSNKINVELEWIEKIFFYNLLEDFYTADNEDKWEDFDDKYWQILDNDFIYYMFLKEDEVLYIGRTGIKTIIFNRWFDHRHQVIPRIMFSYPKPEQIKITVARIENISTNKRTRQYLDTIERILIEESNPLFNKRKGEIIYSYREKFTIINKGDFEPLRKKYTVKFD